MFRPKHCAAVCKIDSLEGSPNVVRVPLLGSRFLSGDAGIFFDKLFWCDWVCEPEHILALLNGDSTCAISGSAVAADLGVDDDGSPSLCDEGRGGPKSRDGDDEGKLPPLQRNLAASPRTLPRLIVSAPRQPAPARERTKVGVLIARRIS